MLTTRILTAVMPHARTPDVYVGMLDRAMDEFEINTPLRTAAFLAQIAHESGQLNRTEENLNYSAEALRTMFGSHFSDVDDMSYFHRQPERIANRVYANRMGNGPEDSGDGWAFRGRGLIQLTGRAMYDGYESATGVTVIDHPEALLFARDASRSAGWFWHMHGLNELADADNFERITRRINGGLNGQAERVAFYTAAKAALGI